MIGVVDLRDVAWRTGPYASPYLDSLGLSAEEETVRSLEPPEVLLILGLDVLGGLLARHRAWLKQARAYHIFILDEGEPDDELRELITAEYQEYCPDFASLTFLFDDPQALLKAIQSELEHLRPQDWPSTIPPLAQQQPRPFAAGSWLELPSHPYRDAETVWPRLVCVREGAPSLLVPQWGAFLSLADGVRSERDPLVRDDVVAVYPDGTAYLDKGLGNHMHGGLKRVDLRQRTISDHPSAKGAPFGIEPGARFAWTGHRCTFGWCFLDSREVCPLGDCEHDRPCGHDKKQYGFLDNEPCWVHLSRSYDAYLSVFQKDAIVTSSLPVRWRRHGPVWVAENHVGTDPFRALFFCNERSTDLAALCDPNACDERESRPAIVLGPDEQRRYALDHSKRVFRLTNEESLLVHEASPTFGVYSRDHRLQRLGEGRLLGGWDRYLTVHRHGRLYRESLDGTEVEDLGPEERPISWAFSLPGTANVVLVHQIEEPGEGAETLRVRLV